MCYMKIGNLESPRYVLWLPIYILLPYSSRLARDAGILRFQDKKRACLKHVLAFNTTADGSVTQNHVERFSIDVSIVEVKCF